MNGNEKCTHFTSEKLETFNLKHDITIILPVMIRETIPFG